MISFKEYYFLQEANGYFPTFRKIGSGVKSGVKKGMGAARDYAKDTAKSAWQAAKTPKTYANIARGVRDIAQGAATGYQPMFAKTERSGKSKSLFQRKTLGGQQEHTRAWRDEHIIKGNQLDEDLKKILLDGYLNKWDKKHSEGEVKKANTERRRLKENQAHVRLADDGKSFEAIVDGQFLDNANQIKIFSEPSHYANVILDNIQTYIGKGYDQEQIKAFASKNFNERLFDLIWDSYDFDSYFTKSY